MKKVYRLLLMVISVIFVFFGIVGFFGGVVGVGLFSCAGAALSFWKFRSIGKQIASEKEQVFPAPADSVLTVPTTEVPSKAQSVKKYKVAGVTHYVDNIMALAEEDPDYDMSKRELIAEDRVQERVWKYFFAPQKVELIPEPDNPHDLNAIKVVVDGVHVGYIKSGSCAHLRKVMDLGGIVDIDCQIGGGPYKFVSMEYDENGKEVYTLDKDETHLFVHLAITEKV